MKWIKKWIKENLDWTTILALSFIIFSGLSLIVAIFVPMDFSTSESRKSYRKSTEKFSEKWDKCQKIVNTSVINFNDSEFQECVIFLNEAEKDYYGNK